MPFMTQILDLLLRFLNIDTGTDINADTKLGFFAAFNMVQHQRRQHFQRQIINAIKA